MRIQVLMVILTSAISVSAMAQDNNAAIVINIDDDVCGWDTPTTFSLGRIDAMLNSSGNFLISCHGEVVEGELPDQAVVGISTAQEPLGVCSLGSFATLDWQVTVTPSGKSKFTCHGFVD